MKAWMLLAALGAALGAPAAARAGHSLPIHPVSTELGVRVIATTDQLRTALGVTAPTGALVLEVEPEGPAAKGGLKAGDVVTRVGDEAIGDAGDILDAIASEARQRGARRVRAERRDAGRDRDTRPGPPWTPPLRPLAVPAPLGAAANGARAEGPPGAVPASSRRSRRAAPPAGEAQRSTRGAPVTGC